MVDHNPKEEVPEVQFNVRIATGGNSWIMGKEGYVSEETDRAMVTSEGVRNWTKAEHKIHTFFHSDYIGEFWLGLKANSISGMSKLQINFEGQTKEVLLQSQSHEDIPVGQFVIDKPGYHLVEIIALEKEGTQFADIDQILLSVPDSETIDYCRDEFYWSRRGPSVHLRHEVPETVGEIQWFYSEIKVPQHEDVIGSYFMANGFNHGYFGIQVNSETERRILFSVWSPYNTDNPDEIPEEYKIKLLRKGDGVTSGEFGNEGSGGQSYKVFPWKADVTYGFLLGAHPNGDESTDYVAYFFDPDTQKWNLIAAFRRPKTNSYLLNLYSFLENFIPATGVLERYAEYGNQWVYDNNGWHEITNITFTADNTARKGNRLDYSGGVEENVFILRNCGFADDQTTINTGFSRTSSGFEPKIDFGQLE